MEFRVVEVTSASKVKVKSASITSVIIPTNETLKLSHNQIGFLEGRFSHHWKGAYFQGGILNPDWEGKVTVELLVFGEFEIEVGEIVAHAIILEGENVEDYSFKGLHPWQEEKQ